MAMQPITLFEIKGLFGDRDVQVSIDENTLILVGPNGVGKSSVATIFYYFISRQWSRLLNFEFRSISAVIGGERVTARRDDISGLSQFRRLAGQFPLHSRMRANVNRLIEAGAAEHFFSSDKLPLDERKRLAALLEMPVQEVGVFQRSMWRRLTTETEGELFAAPRFALEQQIKDLLPGRVLYLPTYRRIEKEIRDIFPDFEERYRAYAGDDAALRAGRTASHYIELVSFGMEDVRKNLHDKTASIRDYSLSQYNNLSGVYLRDVIHSRADKFIAKEINSLTGRDIDNILGRVSEAALSGEDKSLLRERIQSIQGKPKGELSQNDRYLAHYFTRLVATTADISKRERDISAFVSVCNAYLSPAKHMEYDERTFSVAIFDEGGRPIDLSVLSSGEKQIVSLFAHMYLEDVQDQVVVIDEPELSLSVPWQKRFLSDILDTGRCGFLLAVTHSPFIYENNLRAHSADLRRMTTSRS